MTSGDRNVRKRNPKRVASFEQELSRVKKALAEWKNKPRKSLEDKIEIGKLESKKKHLTRKRSEKSETHARLGERH